jgi:hypothetical protein
MSRDFWMAAMALGMGCLAGAPLAIVWTIRGPINLLPNAVVQLLRAAPTFVVMFFLFNILPHRVTLFGASLVISRKFTVALSLLPYSASVIAESGAEALRQWRLGSPLAALLLLPNLARIYFVLVMSSGSAAAIGVREGISTILHQADQFQAIGDRLWVFAIGVLGYGLILQGGFLGVQLLRSHLAARIASRRPRTFLRSSDVNGG